jgi:hypothetical protein
MTIAVMQPYLFPYLGYYQLVAAVDSFVFFDDVNFISRGWINRNNILQGGEASLFTVPLVKQSQNKLINEVQLNEFLKWKTRFLKTMEFSYKGAPYFDEMHKWLTQFLVKDFSGISDLACESVSSVANLLDLKVRFLRSSEIEYQRDGAKGGEEKVLAICKILGATHYINPKNGQELYNRSHFSNQHIQLNFIHMADISYDQSLRGSFVPNLSILDVLMFNGVGKTKDLLKQYTLN